MFMTQEKNIFLMQLGGYLKILLAGILMTRWYPIGIITHKNIGLGEGTHLCYVLTSVKKGIPFMVSTSREIYNLFPSNKHSFRGKCISSSPGIFYLLFPYLPKKHFGLMTQVCWNDKFLICQVNCFKFQYSYCSNE